MTREQCAAFVTSCTDDHCTTHDKRVNEFFDRYDREGRGYVSREDFIALYHGAARHKPQVVWSNIHSSKYTNSLKSPEEQAASRPRSLEELPRYKIAHTQRYFDMLFSILDRQDESSVDAWNLLKRITTNPAMLLRILNVDQQKDAETGAVNWHGVISSDNVYKLLYSLEIVESFMEEGDEEMQFLRVFYPAKKANAFRNQPHFDDRAQKPRKAKRKGDSKGTRGDMQDPEAEFADAENNDEAEDEGRQGEQQETRPATEERRARNKSEEHMESEPIEGAEKKERKSTPRQKGERDLGLKGGCEGVRAPEEEERIETGAPQDESRSGNQQEDA